MLVAFVFTALCELVRIVEYIFLKYPCLCCSGKFETMRKTMFCGKQELLSLAAWRVVITWSGRVPIDRDPTRVRETPSHGYEHLQHVSLFAWPGYTYFRQILWT
ncbi:unnamed protein product [Ectocarpus sp. 13 AM-2016]